ncbi:MAG: phage tail protein [Lachnospiraceae bacterium]|nr:phage tail protein [Ruminococcus sp.]MCM1276339.1 phage tail protein [Lachnospiraceae bacterium]
MATIGLDKLYYSVITEGENGVETYGAPQKLAKAMNVDLSVDVAEATLYADDSAAENVREFAGGTITLGIDDLSAEALKDLAGAHIDSNGVIVSSGEDVGNYVAIAFRAKKSNGKYRYYWLYRVKFSAPSDSYETKGDSVNFNTPTIEGSISQRVKENSDGKHPWKAQIDETDANKSIIDKWYEKVYEPSGSTSTASLEKGA